MNNNHPIILTLFLCTIPLLPMNQHNELQLIKPNDYIIAIQYPKPQEINKDLNYIAIGTLDPEEIEEITEYKCCPNPYNNPEYNKKRRTMSLIAGAFGCCCVSCKLCLMYDECLIDNNHCYPTYTCQEVWCPPHNRDIVCRIANGDSCHVYPWLWTIITIASSLCMLYPWMPWHNKNGCNPYKKVVKKVFRKQRNNNGSI